MLPHAHFIAGFLLGIIGWKIGVLQPIDILIIAVVAVLIDIDHYIHYIVKDKDYHPKRFWNASVFKKEYHRSFIHHLSGIAVVVPLIFLLIWVSPRWGYIAMAAYFSHIILDYIALIDKSFSEYKFSNFLGFKIPWNFGQEAIFLMISVVCMVFLSLSI